MNARAWRDVIARSGCWPASSSGRRRVHASREHKPGRQCRRLLLCPPRTGGFTAESRQPAAELLLGLSDRRGRDRIQIPFAPDRARQVASGSRVFHHAPKEPPLERMDPDVPVPDALRIDQAADHDARAEEAMSLGLVVTEQGGHRLRSEALNRRHEP